MNAFTIFLTQYGLLAIFLLLFTKSIGVPIPIPADLLVLTAAAQAGMGKVGLWQAFGALFLAVVLGGLIQYLLARGPGRGIVHRFGRYLGFTPARLEAASVRVRKGGIPGIGLAMLIPGIRGVAIVAAGLAALPVRSFLAGLVLGSALMRPPLNSGTKEYVLLAWRLIRRIVQVNGFLPIAEVHPLFLTLVNYVDIILIR